MRHKLALVKKRDISGKSAFKVLLGLLCLNILAGFVAYNLSRSRILEVSFFDVGQGDAIFIQTPQRHQILIDGGPDLTVLEKLAKEMPFWDRTIDLIVLTHPEHDHMRGLIEVLKRYKVENILWTGIIRHTDEYDEWRKLIREEKARIYIARSGQKIIFHASDQCNLKKSEPCDYLSIFFPLENLEGKDIRGSNNTSIVAKLTFGKNSFLFTGDAGRLVENKLVGQDISLGSDVLKVGHHGSRTSSGEDFIKAVLPEIAVISVGGNNEAGGDNCNNKKRNRYGHPNCEVLALFKKFGIKVLRTDLEGDIKIFSDGRKIKVKTQYPVSNF